MIQQIAALIVMVALSFGGGYWLALKNGEIATAEALAKAADENRKHNDEVVNGWAAAVGVLRARIRAGYVPRIPGGVPPEADPARRPDGGTSDPVPAAGELDTCKRERQRLIEDCALTTIQLKGLQEWAK